MVCPYLTAMQECIVVLKWALGINLYQGAYLSSFDLFQRGWLAMSSNSPRVPIPQGDAASSWIFLSEFRFVEWSIPLWQCWGTPRFSKCILWFVLPWNLSQVFNGWMGTAACNNVAMGCCLAPGDQLALFFFPKLDERSAPLQAHLRSLGKEKGGFSMFQKQTRRSKSGKMKWSLGVTMRRRVNVPMRRLVGLLMRRLVRVPIRGKQMETKKLDLGKWMLPVPMWRRQWQAPVLMLQGAQKYSSF